MIARKEISFILNGSPYVAEVKVTQVLLDFLRDDLGLTGAKEGCGSGDCGACTVLLDGKPVNACLVLAVEAHDKDVLTVEGLARDGKLDPLQQAFVDEFALQCGFCTPGMLMSAKALLVEHPAPTADEVRKAIAGNLCRCTGYVPIVRAIMKAGAASGGR